MAKRKLLWENSKLAFDAQMRAAHNLRKIWENFRRNCGGGMEISAVSHSIVANIVEFCEAVLYGVCSRYASPQGLFKFPTLADLEDVEDCGLFPKGTGKLAKDIAKSGKWKCTDSIEMEMFIELLEKTLHFMNNMRNLVREAGDAYEMYEHVYDILNEMQQMLSGKYIDRAVYDDMLPDYRMDFIIVNNQEKFTEDELDDILDRAYDSGANNNAYKSLAPAYIWQILKEHTDEKHAMTKSQIKKALEKEFELKVSDSTIKRIMNSFAKNDPHIGAAAVRMPDGTVEVGNYGYWYTSEEFDE